MYFYKNFSSFSFVKKIPKEKKIPTRIRKFTREKVKKASHSFPYHKRTELSEQKRKLWELLSQNSNTTFSMATSFLACLTWELFLDSLLPLSLLLACSLRFPRFPFTTWFLLEKQQQQSVNVRHDKNRFFMSNYSLSERFSEILMNYWSSLFFTSPSEKVSKFSQVTGKRKWRSSKKIMQWFN